METFEDRLEFGWLAEEIIKRWLISKGDTVIPMYGKSKEDYKGPAIHTPAGALTSPDLLVINPDKGIKLWVEVKRKKTFGWHRNTQRFTTALPLKYYLNYIKVMEHLRMEVWIFFLFDGGTIKDTDKESPTGLFASKLSHLINNEAHRYDRPGRPGMVYFPIGALRKLASLRELHDLSGQKAG